LDVAKVEIDVTKNDQIMVEKEDAADETTPSVSDAELDATLDNLMAANKAPAEARMSR
jgi:hypothetical protein